METKITTQKGIGLIEFRQHEAEIKTLWESGHNKKMIYDKCTFTITYRQFVKIFNREILVGNKTINKPVKTFKSSEAERKKKKFHHNPTMTAERRKELF